MSALLRGPLLDVELGFVTLFVILVAVGAFFRWDVWLPVRDTMEKQTEILGHISNTQVQIRDEQRRGVWRATEPPAPNELPKGVEPAKDP